MASNGLVTFAESTEEYAVYDQAQTYGRWPRTQQGHGFASQAYGALTQSVAHGIAYTATGYQDPARLGLPTAPVMKSQSYAAPLSFVGSTRRLIAWATKVGQRSPGVGVVAWIFAIAAMLFVWTFLVFWYMLIFGVFGIFVIPFRLIRRSSRKSLHVQQTTLATQQAMYQQQMATMQRQQAPQNGSTGQNGPSLH